MSLGLSTGTMWRASIVVGLGGVIALAFVSARLVIGDWLGPKFGAEISESALRQGLHRTTAPETAALAQMLDPAHQTSTISGIRNSACSNRQPYVSSFASGHRLADMSGVKKRAADVLSGRWKDIDITRQNDQAYMASLSRGERYKVHAFQFLDDLMILVDATDESERDRILSYSATILSDYAKGHFFANNDYRTDHSGNFVWYDMGAGLRASLVGFVVSRAACDLKIPDEDIEMLTRFAADHLYYLSTDEYFVSNSNHGVYQSMGLISLCKYFAVLRGCRTATEIAVDRLSTMLNDDFVNGFHKEHSPAYHAYMVNALSALSSLLPLGSPLGHGLIDLCNEVYAKLVWFVRPDRTLAPFGDTDQSKLSLRSQDRSDCAMPASLRWLLSDGEEGEAPVSPLLTDTAAGYAMVRYMEDEERPSEASYLALSAAFHSRTHKHADDLTFVWSEGQRNILIDSGRYTYARKAPPTRAMRAMGFWYDDPKRMYVESTHAHNTIEMDGVSIPRTDDGPYGSALGEGFEAETGLYLLQAAVTREDGALHRRALVLDDSVGLLVLDWISGGDGEIHDFTQWFHFAPEYQLVDKDAEQVTLVTGQDRIQVFSPGVQDVAADRGRTEPRLSGWYSPGGGILEPNSAVGFRRAGVEVWYSTVFNRMPQALRGVDVAGGDGSGLPTSVTLQFGDGRVLRYSLTIGPQGEVVELKREQAAAPNGG